MLEYLRKRMAEPDSLVVSILTEDVCFGMAGIVALDHIGIVVAWEDTTICVPWGAVLHIEIEE